MKDPRPSSLQFLLPILLLALTTPSHTQTPAPSPTPTPPTNLPPPEISGTFTASARVYIHNTSISAAWSALTNFPAYSSWNPFVRSAIVINSFPLSLNLSQLPIYNITYPFPPLLPDPTPDTEIPLVPADEQYPVVGKNLYLRTQIPPLPLPVDSTTPDNPLAISLAYEEIVVADKEAGRLAWKYIAEAILQATRWQAISEVEGEDGETVVLYESREIFAGLASGVLQASMGEGLQRSFEAQGTGLKLFLEGGGGGGGGV